MTAIITICLIVSCVRMGSTATITYGALQWAKLTMCDLIFQMLNEQLRGYRRCVDLDLPVFWPKLMNSKITSILASSCIILQKEISCLRILPKDASQTIHSLLTVLTGSAENGNEQWPMKTRIQSRQSVLFATTPPTFRMERMAILSIRLPLN